MAQYIDKAAIVAEIERRKEEEVNYDENGEFASWADHNHYSTLDSIQDFLDTLEVEEVDIENAVHGTVDFPLIGYDFPNIYPNYKELKEYCIRHCIKDNDKVKIAIVKEK